MENEGEIKFEIGQLVKAKREMNITRRVCKIVFHKGLGKDAYYLTPSKNPQDYWFADELVETTLD